MLADASISHLTYVTHVFYEEKLKGIVFWEAEGDRFRLMYGLSAEIPSTFCLVC